MRSAERAISAASSSRIRVTASCSRASRSVTAASSRSWRAAVRASSLRCGRSPQSTSSDDQRIDCATCSGFSGGVSTFYADGVKWPYSDEITAGIEQQLSGAIRVGAMYYYRTNKAQLGVRNEAVPTSAYTPFQLTIRWGTITPFGLPVVPEV